MIDRDKMTSVTVTVETTDGEALIYRFTGVPAADLFFTLMHVVRATGATPEKASA